MDEMLFFFCYFMFRNFCKIQTKDFIYLKVLNQMLNIEINFQIFSTFLFVSFYVTHKHLLTVPSPSKWKQVNDKKKIFLFRFIYT